MCKSTLPNPNWHAHVLARRAFARVYILCIGGLYGPYYVRLGKGQWSSSSGEHLGISIAYAVAVQFALSGLFHIMLGLEDPFARQGGRGLEDSVHVPELCEYTRRVLIRIEREAKCTWEVQVQRESW